MALSSLGRQVALAENMPTVRSTGMDVEQVTDAANAQLTKTKTGIQESLTAYIPGDFIVAYGTLLTTIGAIRASFYWLLFLSVGVSFAFVWLGAFAEQGKTGWSRKTNGQLFIRSFIGTIACLTAAFTIPGSGWYEYSWFADNEGSALAVVGLCTAVLTLGLKGLQKAGWLVVS